MKAAFRPVAAMSALATLVSMNTAQVAIFKDAHLVRLQDGGKYAKLEQKAQARFEMSLPLLAT